jgi:hypothetical protein
VILAYKKHLAALPSGKEDKHFGGNLPEIQGDKLNKDNVKNSSKNDEVPVEASEKPYFDAVVKTSLVPSENVEQSLPASPSKIGGEDAIKKKNMAKNDRENEEGKQGKQKISKICR